ncbi:MAG: rod shape-determining protein MreD [Bacillota bacterium]
MKGLILAGLLLLNIVIQAMIFQSIPILGTQPDTLLCLVASLGFTNGYFTAAATGMFGGLMFDILFGWPVGANALLYLLTGVLAGMARERLRVENLLYACGFTVGISLIKELLGFLVALIAGVSFPLLRALLLGALPTALLTGIIMLPIHVPLKRLAQCSIMRRRYQEMLD